MAGEDHEPRRGDYRAARIGAAVALVGVVVFIAIVDALSTGYQADPFVLTAFLGTIGALLGIEAIPFLRGPRT